MVAALKRFSCTSLSRSLGVNDPFIETHFIIHLLCDEAERLRYVHVYNNNITRDFRVGLHLSFVERMGDRIVDCDFFLLKSRDDLKKRVLYLFTIMIPIHPQKQPQSSAQSQ